MKSVGPMEVESRAAFSERVGSLGHRAVVVGEAAEAARRFYVFTVPSAPGITEVGVLSSDLGSVPKAVLLDQGRVLLVGHDTWLTWVNIHEGTVAQDRRLGGVFFEFLPVAHDDEVVALHELGALRIDARGHETWRVDTEIVESHRIDDRGNLVLCIMDAGSAVVVSVESGSVLR